MGKERKEREEREGRGGEGKERGKEGGARHGAPTTDSFRRLCLLLPAVNVAR